MTWRVIGAFIILVSLVVWYQNCMSRASFSSMLKAGQITPDGVVAQVSDFGPPPSPTESPTATPTDTPSSPSPSPSATVSSSPTPTPTDTTPSSDNDQLCILINSGNSGQDNKVGYDTAVVYLTSVTAIPSAVCMSSNACLNLINDYLNLTGGIFGGHVGSPPPVTQHYTMQKINGVCQHNPNVAHLSDDQIQQEINKLKANH